MTDDNKFEETETTSPAVVEKPLRGNPAWRKKSEETPKIQRADMVEEGIVTDRWDVQNKDPKMHYCWARKSNDDEISQMLQKGYVPARGKERIMRNPLEANKDEDGETKERGDRILMMCPKSYVNVRRQEQANRFVNVKKAGNAEARAMQTKGVRVESLSESETKRESLME